MPKMIYPQETFDKQTNGTVFYREGKLNDFPSAKEGVFESWKYNFEAGRQVFKATDDKKVYEKRLVKDIHGVARWTGWMEIPYAESNGVQAIAINDRPLQLPTADGAIKLQITPASIDTYSKREIYELIDEKIRDNNDKAYIYVEWRNDPDTNERAEDAYRVLQLTFPDGGLIDKFYLVEPKPGTPGESNYATYWIYGPKQQISGGKVVDDWISIEAPDLRAFVTYPALYEHTDDFDFHLSGNFEREKWNEAAEHIEAISGEIHTHMEDVGDELSPHISEEERKRWNDLGKFTEFPENDGKRYVVENGEYVEAYEQVAMANEKAEYTEITGLLTTGLKDNSTIRDGLLAEFNQLLAENKKIIKIQLQFSGINTAQTYIWFETNTGIKTPKWTTTSGSQIYDFDGHTQPFDTLTLYADDDKKSIVFKDIKLYFLWKPVASIDIGDGILPINLIGPEEGQPTYNGLPLKLKTVWGTITGDPAAQSDLNKRLAELLRGKISTADMESHKRWDVYRDTVIAGLLQQPGSTSVTETLNASHLIKVESDNVVLFSGLKAKLQEMKDNGSVPYSARLYVTHIESDDFTPIYFETDNSNIAISPTIGDGKFNWSWPGATFEDFDEIRVRVTDTAIFKKALLHTAKLEINGIIYGDVVAESKDYEGNLHNWTQNAQNYEVNAEDTLTLTAGILDKEADQPYYTGGNILIKAEDGLLDTYVKEVITKVLEDSTTEIAGDAYLNVSGDINAEAQDIKFYANADFNVITEESINLTSDLINIGKDKDYGDEEADTEITVYGQEIDNRYAPREPFVAVSGLLEVVSGDLLTEIRQREQADNTEAGERKAADDILSGLIKDNADRIDVISGVLEDTISELADEAAVRENEDAALSAEIENVSGYFNNYYDKTEVYNKPEVDDLIKNAVLENLPNETITYTFRGEDDPYYNSGIITYKLDPKHSVYRFIINKDSKVYFDNVILNREYVFYIDQIDVIHKFTVANTLHNAHELTDGGLDNLLPNGRTVMNLFGTDNPDPDLSECGFTINYIIPKVMATVLNGNRIILGNILGTLHNSSATDKAVDANGRKTGEIYAQKNVDEGLLIRSEFMNGDGVTGNCTGWRHHDSGTDWTLTVIATGEVVGSGLVGDNQVVTLNQFYGDIRLDFQVSPQMVLVALDPNHINHMQQSGVVKSLKNFGQYQAYYNEIVTEIIMEDNPLTKIGWFIYKQTNNIGMTLDAHSYAWKYRILELPSVPTGQDIPVLYILPWYYKRIYDIELEMNNAPITNKVDLVYFEDEEQSNKMYFVFDPLDATDPISIIDYDSSKIEVLGVYGTYTNEYARIRLLNKPSPGDIITFTTQTASGTTKIWNLKAVLPVTTFEIKVGIEGDLQLDSPYRQYLHRPPYASIPWDAHIEWDDTPTYIDGTWAVITGDSRIEVESSVEDTAVILAKAQGDAILRFTSAFDPTKWKEIEIRVYTHVEHGKIIGLTPNSEGHYQLETSDKIQLGIAWFDKEGGNQITEADMENTNVTWETIPATTDRGTIGAQNGLLTISNRKIPDGTIYEDLVIQFTSIDNIYDPTKPDPKDGPSVIDQITIRIYRGNYWLTFTTKDEFATGVSNIPGLIGGTDSTFESRHQADKVLQPYLNFTNGYTISDETLAEIQDLPNFVMWPGDPSDGITRFTFNMPYNDVEIDVKSKKI